MIYVEKPRWFVPEFEAVGCFFEIQGRILLLLRPKTARVEPLKWGFPGGKFNNGETARDAVQREVKEETGLVMGQNQFHPAGLVFVEYKCSPCKFIYHMFSLNLPFYPEIILNPAEHIAHAWIPPSSAKSVVLMEDAWECIELVYEI